MWIALNAIGEKIQELIRKRINFFKRDDPYSLYKQEQHRTMRTASHRFVKLCSPNEDFGDPNKALRVRVGTNFRC